MSTLALLLSLAAVLRWLDMPRTTLIAASPLVVVLAGVAGLATGL